MDTALARDAVSDALDALLVTLVALDGLDDAEVPEQALDAALRGDRAVREARAAFHVVFEEVRHKLGDEQLELRLLELEEKANAVTVAATDVAFRLGLGARR